MRNRGKKYWDWADADLHCRNYDERLPCGRLINLQVRLTRDSITQLFLGIYGIGGELLLEEYHDQCHGQTPSTAMAWGLKRAHEWIARKPLPPMTSPPGKSLRGHPRGR